MDCTIRHMASTPLKKIFLSMLVAAFTLAAIAGILVILLGTFGEFELRILLTTLFLGLFSLTSLCAAALLDRRRHHPLGYAGLIASSASFILSIDILWISWFLPSDDLIKSCVIFGILAFSCAHASILLLPPARKTIVSVIRGLTLVTIGLLAGMLSSYALQKGEISEPFFFRLLGTLAILDVLGTVMTPIALVLSRPKTKAKPPAKAKLARKTLKKA